MSRKQPVFNISLLAVPVLLIALFLVVPQLIVITSAQAPSAPRAMETPIALVKTIVIQGKKVDKAAVPQAAVERAGATLAAEPGMMLYPSDNVTTGKDSQLAILFLDEAAEKDNEVLLDATTNVQLGPLFIRSGRILARVKEKFQVRTARAQWTVSGTEYELAVQADSANSVRVLKGEVQVEAGSFASISMALPKPNNHVGFTNSHHTSSKSELAQGVMSFVAVSGKAIDIDREFILTNSCQQRHVYRVTNPLNLSWFQFKGDDQFAIEGNATRNIKFSIRLDATNVSAGTFDSQITFPCLDCSNEPGCRIGGFLLPITMRVLGSPTASPAAAPVVNPTPAPTVAPTPGPTPAATPTPKNAITVTRMQELVLPSAGDPRRAEATPQQVEQILSWSHELIVSGAPKYSTQSVVPYYQTATEREAAFTAARRSSIINDDRKSKQILAETYIDWGNGAKAEEELKGVEVTILELPGQLTTLGEARRLIGDLTKAEVLIKRAIGLDSKLTRAYNSLGSVYLDQAKVDLDRKDFAAARASLDKAKAQFAKAMENKTPVVQTQHHAQQAQPKAARAEAVVQANLAEVHLRMGVIARATDDNAGALREFQAAEQAFAQAAKIDASYAFALTGLGEVYRELATTQETLGNQSRAEQYLKRAQDQYDQALQLHPDLAEAYVGLGRVLEENGRKDEALKQYRKAILMRPELADPHYYYARALADVNRQQAAEQARLFLKLERPSLMAGERAKNAQDVIASRTLGGKTAASGTNR